MRSSFVLLAIFAAGCPTPDPSLGLQTTPAAQQLDYNEFVCNVMPTLIRRCSYLACHGNPDHAFRLYSIGKLRIGDTSTRDQRDAPLTQAEIEANFDSAAGVSAFAATPTDRAQANLSVIPLLQKPLAARFGGGEHHGVAIFPQPPAQKLTDDSDWEHLVAWVGGAKQPNPPSQACQSFFMILGVTPQGM